MTERLLSHAIAEGDGISPVATVEGADDDQEQLEDALERFDPELLLLSGTVESVLDLLATYRPESS